LRITRRNVIKKENKKAVAVAMSDGVDSSVAAFLLQKEYQVFGITMFLGSFNKQAVKNAKILCQKLKIPHYTIDLQEQFKKQIIQPFCREYSQAKTPNPCVWCNPKIKFGLLFKKARQLKADYLATGHYARLRRETLNPKSQILNKSQISNFKFQTICKLQKAKDKTRDQSYFLYRLNQKQLKYLIFPLGELTKNRVKQIARENNLVAADKPESREICFIPDNDYRKFLKKNFVKIMRPHDSYEIKKGPIKDLQGRTIGEHQGLPFYTIGQRKGLVKGQKKPVYVIRIDKTKNTLIIGQEKDLYQKQLIVKDLNWIQREKPKIIGEVSVKIRYQHKPAKGKITFINQNKIKIEFKKAQRAVALGQSAVIYDREEVLGGGVIGK